MSDVEVFNESESANENEDDDEIRPVASTDVDGSLRVTLVPDRERTAISGMLNALHGIVTSQDNPPPASEERRGVSFTDIPPPAELQGFIFGGSHTRTIRSGDVPASTQGCFSGYTPSSRRGFSFGSASDDRTDRSSPIDTGGPMSSDEPLVRTVA